MRIFIETVLIIACIACYVFFAFTAPDAPWSAILLIGCVVALVVIMLLLHMLGAGFENTYARRRRLLRELRAQNLRDGGITYFRRTIDYK